MRPGGRAVMYRIANPSRGIRLPPGPPNYAQLPTWTADPVVPIGFTFI